MAKTNGVDKLSLAQLLDLEKRIELAIAARKAADAVDVKEKMQRWPKSLVLAWQSYSAASAAANGAPSPLSTATPRMRPRPGPAVAANPIGLSMLSRRVPRSTRSPFERTHRFEDSDLPVVSEGLPEGKATRR